MDTNRLNRIEGIFEKAVTSGGIQQAAIFVQNSNGDFSYNKGYGGIGIDSPLLMASVTKLLTTTCILAVLEQGKLSLDDKISKYFDKSILDGLHIYKGEEFSYELTISDLLFQISGLPDVYEEGKNCLKVRVIKEDFSYDFSEIAEMTKKLNPHFKPRTASRAYYADINFDMLGEILERTLSQRLSQIYRHYIFKPLGLKGTYLPESEDDFVPSIFCSQESIHRPEFVMSSRASGGCVSTAREMMTFLKAFIHGELFDISILHKLSSCNKLQASMWPIYYGSGYMRIPLGGLTTFFMGKGELKGHSGSTGSFAFYCPIKDLFITGNLNQMDNAALPIRLSIRIAM